MTIRADYVVVGAGLTGATIARMLHDAGREVVVLEARDRIGGNVADAIHPSGIRYNLHGPHYFRTSSMEIQSFAERFAAFYPFAARLVAQVGSAFFPWPLQRETLEHFAGAAREREFATVAPVARRAGTAGNFEERMLEQVPELVYHTFIEGYTRKQWGTDPAALDVGLAGRIEIRDDGDTRLSKAIFQALPLEGFSAWVTSMLSGIETRLDTDFHAAAESVGWGKKLVYTGPIDRYFDYCFGRLPYRMQRRHSLFVPSEGRLYPVGQVNCPQASDGEHVRTIEWLHMMPPGSLHTGGTLLTLEFPADSLGWGDSEYPFPSQPARALHQRYETLAKRRSDILFCGRLGEYRYLDMDQAIGRGMLHARRLLQEEKS